MLNIIPKVKFERSSGNTGISNWSLALLTLQVDSSL